MCFAPSGIDYTISHLTEHFILRSDSSESSVPEVADASSDAPTKLQAKLAAIGLTTATHLREHLRLDVSVVAAKPSAEELAKAIKSACGSGS